MKMVFCAVSNTYPYVGGGTAIPKTMDLITAFYFPLKSGIERVDLSIGGAYVAHWTPEGSDFFCAEAPPLVEILDEARQVPRGVAREHPGLPKAPGSGLWTTVLGTR